jgi:hypothetical protein
VAGKKERVAGHLGGRILGTVTCSGSRSTTSARMIVDIVFDVLEMRETAVKRRPA